MLTNNRMGKGLESAGAKTPGYSYPVGNTTIAQHCNPFHVLCSVFC